MQTGLDNQQAIPAEVDRMLDTWRSSAILVVFVISCMAVLPAMIAVLSGRIFNLPWPLRALCLLLFAVMMAASLVRKWPLQLRVNLILGVMAVFAAIQLLVTQLPGSGRLSLLTLPIIATIFLGPRKGWWMMGLGLSVFTAVAVLAQTGWPFFAAPGTIEGVATTSAFWLLQGMRLTGDMLLLMLLLTQFLNLQRKTMIAERTALLKLEAETADRRRLEAEVARVSEAERRNLGSELHDGLCQHLTAALLNCAALENRSASGNTPDRHDLTLVRKTIEESIGMAHDVARGLCPVDLEPEGFVPALEDLCHRIRHRRKIDCELQIEQGLSIKDANLALQVYRIVGEALNNATKHANCSRIVIHLTRKQGELMLSVTDNGKGFSQKPTEGLGLRIMAYRAGLIGGSLAIESAPGQGTTVTCRIPDSGGAT